ncbi:MAG TPA: ABC transporter ATP-binding protein [Nitrospira sp.]
MDAICTEALTKSFRSNWPGKAPATVVRDLNLTVHREEVFGFLGPNGSGKTTTMKMILGLTQPTKGRVQLLGRPASEVNVRQQIGFLPEAPYFYTYLTAEEVLLFYGRLAGLSGPALNRRVEEMLEMVGLVEARRRQLGKFSKGMLQRVGLAQALIHDPTLVILDEPMSGLDPIGRKDVRDLIMRLRKQGKTVFFSTHIIPDVETLCDRVGIIAGGRLLACGRVDELVEGQTKTVEVVCDGLPENNLLPLNALASSIVQQNRQYLITLSQPERLEELLAAIKVRGGKLVSVTPHKGSLEELFMSSIRVEAKV